MFKMSAFSVDTGWQTTPPLVDGVVHNRTDWFSWQCVVPSWHHTVRCVHKSGDVINFIIVACRISSRLKWYKNYKNRLWLAKVIVKNKMSRFFMVQCVFNDTHATERCLEVRFQWCDQIMTMSKVELSKYGVNVLRVAKMSHV